MKEPCPPQARAAASPPPPLSLDLRPSCYIRTLGLGILFFTGLNMLVQVLDTQFGWSVRLGLFALDGEVNLPTWFSAMNLLSAAGLLGVIAAARHRLQDRLSRYWAGLSLVFVYLSADEICGFHEKLEDLVPAGASHFGWTLPLFLMVGLVGLVFLRFLWQLPTETRRWFVTAGVVYVFGALGMEVVNYQYFLLHGERVSLAYQCLTDLEETLEMSGVLIFLHALLAYCGAHLPPVQVSLAPQEPAAQALTATPRTA